MNIEKALWVLLLVIVIVLMVRTNIKELFEIMFGWITGKDMGFVVLLAVLFICFQTFAQLSAYKENFRYVFCVGAVIALGFQLLVSKSKERQTRFVVLGWLVVCFGMGMNEKFIDSLFCQK